MREEQINVQWVNIESLKEADFNPFRRTTDQNTKGLVANMAKNGFRAIYPIVIGNDGIVGDGHRRLAAAKILGLKEVPVVIDPDLTSAEIYMLQLDILKQTGKDLFDAIARGMPTSVLPAKQQKQLRRIADVAGEDAINYMIDRKLSPSSIQWVELAIKYINRHADDINTDHAFGFKVLKWMFEYNETLGIQSFVRDGKDVNSLLWSINYNKPLRRV